MQDFTVKALQCAVLNVIFAATGRSRWSHGEDGVDNCALVACASVTVHVTFV
jgi:hypothetical protein